ncbi:MAG: D-2-hydroxyacid dehydrogenase [Acidobacteriota bacterium]|nr:D-2-hydroxyacid dehydrogenase [Acidobacteriota bacterium]
MTARTESANTKLLICVVSHFTQWNAQPVMAETIRQRWPKMKVVHLETFESLPAELPDADIFVGSVLRPPDFAAAKKLKWVHSTSAGVSQLTYPELRNSGIVLTNASGVFSVPMAEHTIGLLLALARNFPDTLRQQEKAAWSQQQLWDQPQHLSELNGNILLIVGYGSIGREVAMRAKAMGMRIWGVTRSGKGDLTHAEKIIAAADSNIALPEADYVLLCAPETPETQRLIGTEQLSRMKRGGRLINVGRGSLLDEGALIAALENGTLSGAAIDVTETEPLPPTSPLWRAPNLFITPHTSAVSDRLWYRETTLLMDLLERWFDGRELINRVDFERGY